MYENSKRHNEKTQTKEQKKTFERRKRNNAAMKAALVDGLDKFNGECDKHGKVEFSIQRKKKEYTGTYPYQYKCIHCRLENSRFHAEKRKKLRLEAKAKVNDL